MARPRRRFRHLLSQQQKRLISFLYIQYKLSRGKYLRKPSCLCSRDRRKPRPKTIFQPNVDEMKQVFDKFDSNKDGKISQEEYKATLRSLGLENMVQEVPNIFRVADLDGDGFIDFKEFVEVQKMDGGIRTMDIQSAFRMFDENGDGKISAEEIQEMMRRLGERCSLQECQRMVKAVDTDGDGMVDMDEFMAMMTQSMRSA